MRPVYKDVKAYLAVILFFLIPAVLLFPEYTGRFERSDDLHFDETNVGGMSINRLQKGDRIDISYTSTSDIGVYFMTEEQSDEFRSINIDKDPPPDPVYTGTDGDIVIKVEESGNYEIILWNSTLPGTGGEVEYSGKVHRQRDTTISIVTSISFLLISIILVVLLIIQRLRHGRETGHDLV